MPETPYLSIDLGQVRENFRALRTAFPQAQIRYAVKANPAEPILRLLTTEGSAFDVASVGEIDTCGSAGIDGGLLTFGNTVKKPADIARAYKRGCDGSRSTPSREPTTSPSTRRARRWNAVSHRTFHRR